MALMPRLSDKTREQRRQHIPTSAWRCFNRDGFHATSIEDVMAATEMSSSAVYRYFRSKEEIVRASAEVGVARVRDIFMVLLDRDPCPTPAETLASLVAELHTRTDNPEYDMSRVALQTWAEALREPLLHEHARTSYRDTHDHIVRLTARWRDAGQIPASADTKAVAATVLSLMQGLIVMHHLVDDVSADALLRGVSPRGAATDSSSLHRVREVASSATST
jgi:AcrR family transcriptional regulator